MMVRTLSHARILAAVLIGVWAALPADDYVRAVNSSEKLSPSTRPILGRSRAIPAEENAQRLREGTKITNRLGRFRQAGDRAEFVTENNIELGGLPNLNLERVVRMLKSVDEPESIWWSVSGLVTEFSGRNYLLIERAVYKSATPPPIPEKVEP